MNVFQAAEDVYQRIRRAQRTSRSAAMLHDRSLCLIQNDCDSFLLIRKEYLGRTGTEKFITVPTLSWNIFSFRYNCFGGRGRDKHGSCFT